MKYMIHTCNRRRWYVNKILIPDMLEQGIKNFFLVRTRRFELRTSCLSSKRSKPTELCPQKDCKDKQKDSMCKIFYQSFVCCFRNNSYICTVEEVAVVRSSTTDIF